MSKYCAYDNMNVKLIRMVFNSILLLEFIELAQSLATFTYNGISNCSKAEKNPVYWNGVLENYSRNVFILNGEVNFKEVVAAPIEVYIISLFFFAL